MIVSIAINIKLSIAFVDLQQKFQQKKIFNYYNRASNLSLIPIDNHSIVFLGDSHIEHFEVTGYYNDHNIKNFGNIGDQTEQIINRISFIASRKPKKIFVEVGVNDLINGKTTEHCIENIKKIFSMIDSVSPGTTICFISIPPIRNLLINLKIKSVNQNIEDYCKKKNIEFINIFDMLNSMGVLNKKYDCGDGIHLNTNGYAMLKKMIEPHLYN